MRIQRMVTVCIVVGAGILPACYPRRTSVDPDFGMADEEWSSALTIVHRN